MNFNDAMIALTQGLTVARKGHGKKAIKFEYSGGYLVQLDKLGSILDSEPAKIFAEDIIAEDWAVINPYKFDLDSWNF